MNTSNTVSVGKILWKILNNPLAASLTYDEAAEYAVEAIRLIGAPLMYEDKLAEVKIQEKKGKLPTDILYIRGVRMIDEGITFREATDTFHKSENHNETSEFTYTISKGIIFSSVDDTCLEVAYKGLLLDENGYPLIVDNQKVKLAIEYYILDRYLEPIWMMGKISDKAFNRISQERHFYMASANNSMQMPSPDKMESIMNGLNRIILHDSAHRDAFKNYGDKEKIRKY